MLPETISPGARKTEDEHRRDICTLGRWVAGRGYVAATDGNISVRLDPQRVLTSPTAVNKGMMTSDDLVITDMEGRKLAGNRNPSSELAMHLLIYKRRPDVSAVCHAHPPVATGYAAAGIALNKALVSEVVLALGCIPVARYGTPGTPELTEALEPLVPNYDAILMANHGVVCYGPDLLTAWFRMETTEHFARVSLVTELLGKQVLLSSEDVMKLLEARARYGLSTAAQVGAECPVTADAPAAAAAAGRACACASGEEHVALTRGELTALIEEAIARDRKSRG
jgi:L-fuculose-phosphate aldolase